MKRLLGVLVVLFMVMGQVNATSPAIPEDAQVREVLPSAYNLEEIIREKDAIHRSGSIPVSDASLEIASDGRYVIKANGITCSFLLPFGWYAFTQDFFSQLELYMAVFKDPLAIYNSMIETGLYLLAFNGELDGNHTEMYMYRDNLSTLYGNLDDQSDTAVIAARLIYTRSFPNAEVDSVILGNHTYITMLQKFEDYEILFVETIKSGYNVRFQAYSNGKTFVEEEKQEFYEIIKSVQLS